MNCLKFWAQLLSDVEASAALKPLVYPLVQVSLLKLLFILLYGMTEYFGNLMRLLMIIIFYPLVQIILGVLELCPAGGMRLTPLRFHCAEMLQMIEGKSLS